MAQLIGDLLILNLVISFACILFVIAGVIEKTLEIKERKELKRELRQRINSDFKKNMSEIGESAEECYEVLENDKN